MNDDSDVQLVAPFIFLFAVTMTAFFWGRVTAFLGAIGACLTFCFLLFPPLGSIRSGKPYPTSSGYDF
jgi:K+-sensing histidine kinase KdpD